MLVKHYFFWGFYFFYLHFIFCFERVLIQCLGQINFFLCSKFSHQYKADPVTVFNLMIGLEIFAHVGKHRIEQCLQNL